jgi:predicted Zn-dependent protease
MERRLLQAAKKLQLGGANEQGSGAYNFEVFAVKDSSINAFALPGGFIGFHTGLLVSAESDAEVASVMGHETGHVLQRHLARQMDKQTTNTMIAIAGMVLGALAMSRNPQAAAGLMQGGQAAAINNQLSYSRDAEREADRIGFQILDASGYDVNGAPGFFQRLQKATGIMDKGVPAYVRTHPLTTDRIADMQDRARTVPSRNVPTAVEFYFIKARARMEQAGSSSGLYDLKNTFDSLSKQQPIGKQIEGIIQPGDELILIEDVVTSGASVLNTIKIVESNGIKIKQIICILDREEGGIDKLIQLGYNVKSLLKVSELMDNTCNSKL